MCRSRPWTLEETHAEFERKLSQVIFRGIFHRENPTVLDEVTHAALSALAEQFPNAELESVLSVRQDFEHQLDGSHAAIRLQGLKRSLSHRGYTI